MPDLPSGTVTFLFTDIEGSTRLLQKLRDRYGELLADHHRLLREAFAERGGEELGTQGDAFFVSFRRAKDAVAAAVAAQRALAAHPWPDGLEVKVRMGLHTGEPSTSEAGPISISVHRAARIMAAGHGGQVLLSSTTRDLVEDELPEDVGVRELGEHRLKDLDRPERIHQLVIAGLPDEFPPLKTLESQAIATAPFAGREDELAEAAEAALKRRRARRRVAIVVAAGALVAGAVLAFLALRGGDDGAGAALEVPADVVAVIDPATNRVTGSIPVGARPSDLVFGAGSLWVANLDDQTISRIDPGTSRVTKVISTGDAPRGLAAGPDAIWLASAPTNGSVVTVRRVAPRFDTIVQTLRVRGSPALEAFGDSIAVAGGSVWVVPQGLGAVSRIDVGTGKTAAVMDAGTIPTTVGVGAGATWVTDVGGNSVLRIDATNVVTDTIQVGGAPAGLAFGAGALWVAQYLGNAVVRIDPVEKAVKTTIRVGRSPIGVAVGAGAVWVANSRDGTVSRIDPASNEVSEVIRVGGSPQFVAVARGRVWVTVQEAAGAGAGEAADASKTVRVNTENSLDLLDPAFVSNELAQQLSFATCAKLLNYPDRPAPAGAQLVPEVAAALPKVSADGRTYTFRIRKGFRFSPPSLQPVTAASFKHAIERTLSPRLQSPGGALGTEIAGVVAEGDRLTIRLTEPVPDLPNRLAEPYFCAIPTDTPIAERGVRTVPSAGPYYVSSLTPGQSLVLERNPSYSGRRPHRPDRIVVTFGIGKAETLAGIEAGTVDYAADGIPPTEHQRLASRYGSGSPAAKAGRQRYFVEPVLSLEYLELNAKRPLFADVRMRRAVNFAVDRTALARQGSAFVDPGFPANATDQYLPPAMPGFADVEVYPLTPDVAAARRLTRGRRATAVLYVCELAPCPQYAQIISENLRAIGIETEVRVFPFRELLSRLARKGEPFDLVYMGNTTSSPDPGGFFLGLLTGTLIRATSDADVPFRDKLEAAARLTGRRRSRAYAELDAELARTDAPWVAIATQAQHDFFSARMGCHLHHPIYGVDFGALCVRS
jgi:YVTN family beta-propeller protein